MHFNMLCIIHYASQKLCVCVCLRKRVCGRNANNGRNQRSKYRNIKVHVSKNVIESKLLSAFVKGHAFHTLRFRELYIGSDMSFKLSTLFNSLCVCNFPT